MRMPDKISPPENWQDFERCTRVLFECILKNKKVKNHGRTGQQQNGVDIFGIDLSHGKSQNWVGVQCKGRDSDFGGNVTKKELRQEAENAKNFNPRISEFYLVTTARNDAKIEEVAREITDENAQSENGFTVDIWGWDDIKDRLREPGNEKAREAFDSNYNSSQTLNVTNNFYMNVDNSVNVNIKEGIISNEITNNSKEHDYLKTQIEGSNKLIDKREFYTAYKKLDGLEKELDGSSNLADKAKILTLKGLCKHEFGEFEDSAELFLKSYDIYPEAEGADARKVLALGLQGKCEEAIEFGLQCLDNTKNKKILCAYIIHAKISCKVKEESPFDFIPKDVEEDKDIAIAKVNYLRSKGDIKWQKLTCDAYSKYPDDEVVMRLYAEAILDEINFKVDNSKNKIIETSDITKLEKIIEILNSLHNTLKLSEIAWIGNHIYIICNLANAHVLNNDTESAQNILDEAKEHDPNNKFLAAGMFIIAGQNNDLALMEELIPNLPEEGNTIIGKMQFFINSQKWDAVKDLPEVHYLERTSEANKAFYEMGKAFAGWQLDNNINIKKITKALEVKYPEEIIIPIMSHHIAFLNNDDAWRKKCYHKALEGMEEVPIFSRFMLANMAYMEQDFKTIPNILEDIVDYSIDSEYLRILALSYTNILSQKSSRDFINKLGEELKDDPYYAGVIGAIESNRGNLADAEFYFRKSLKADSNELQFQLGLIDTLARDNRDDDMKTHLRTINLSTLYGSPIEKIKMASIFIKYSEVKRGLEYAYKITVDNYDNAEILDAYTTVFLLSPDKEKVEIETVEMNTCVEFLYNEKIRKRVFIEEKNNPLLNHDMHSDKAAKLFIGEKKGKTITIEPDIGTPEKYEIIDIIDTSAGLFREILQRPQLHSSGEPNFYKYELKENDGVPDFEPLLKDMKNISEKREKIKNEIINLYLNKQRPISMLAKISDLDIISVASLIKNEGCVIQSCIGSSEEIEKAIKLCESALETGIVLDTYTAIVAQQCGILPILKLIFSKIMIPRFAIDELNALKEKINFMDCQNGQNFSPEITPEYKSELVLTYINMIEDFKNTFEICPSDFPKPPSDLELSICKGSNHILDSGHLCVANKIPILSDDMHYRELISQFYQVEGFWLQIPLFLALQKKVIDINTYVRYLSKLAECKHSYIFINAQTLIAACTLDEENLESLEHLLKLIYCSYSDISSHTKVLLEFINMLWNNESIPEIRKKKVTGLILARFASLAQSNDSFKKMIPSLLDYAKFRYDKRLYDYIISWLEGHFINI